MEGELQKENRLEANQLAKKKRNVIIFTSFASLILWGCLAYGGYIVALKQIKKTEQKVEANLTIIQEQINSNALLMNQSLQAIQEEMIAIQNELALIQEDLAFAGETLSGTDKTKVALQERIQALDRQLSELQQSIARLEDASR